MKSPYGISDFYKIITDGYFYIDRTNKIRLIEDAGGQLLFLRPRRFGKSLLLSMLENYYDVAKADEFERLFGHLAIGQNPTDRHNQYFILTWDFSAVDPQGDVKVIKQALYDHLNSTLKDFSRRYRELLPHKIEINRDNAIYSFESALSAVQAAPYRLYLLIDEYDNFANEVMMSRQPAGKERYQSFIEGEGALKTVFKAVKSAGSGRGLDKVFITGVSPVVLSDMTSGYNIAKNIYLEPEFNDLCGFWEDEVADTLQQIAVDCNFPAQKADEALDMMRVFYNGYSFTYQAEALIYNPTLALYFMEKFQRDCQYPRKMLDANLAMDKGKIAYISRLPNGGQIVLDALNEKNPLSTWELVDRFGVDDMLRTVKDNQFMLSLLYYFGVLTLTNRRTAMGELIFQIPNLVVKKLYVEQIQDMLLPDFAAKDESQRAAHTFYQTGDMQPLSNFIEQKYFKVFDNRDYRWTNELTVKTAFLTLLFNDTFYIMDSETAIERGYADLTMIARPDMRQYQLLDFLIEFKYVSLQEVNLSGQAVRQMPLGQLKALPLVQQKLTEAKSQLGKNRQILETAYGNALRLHTYSVASVSFDRLVWVEVESTRI